MVGFLSTAGVDVSCFTTLISGIATFCLRVKWAFWWVSYLPPGVDVACITALLTGIATLLVA